MVTPFLETAAENAKKDLPGKTKVYVVGNEGADLDSIMSAIALATFLHYFGTLIGWDDSYVYIPVIYYQSKNIGMKLEIKHHLKLMGIELKYIMPFFM